MPMILSACFSSSFFTRVAAGEADGEACGVGVGVCASAFNGALTATSAAAPAAGRTLTKFRRVIDLRFDFFMIRSARILRAVREHLARPVATPVDALPSRSGYCLYGAVGLLPRPCSLAAPY